MYCPPLRFEVSAAKERLKVGKKNGTKRRKSEEEKKENKKEKNKFWRKRKHKKEKSLKKRKKEIGKEEKNVDTNLNDGQIAFYLFNILFLILNQFTSFLFIGVCYFIFIIFKDRKSVV